MARRTTKSRRRPLTAEDLLSLRSASAPVISPDGEQVVYVVKEVGEKNAYHTRLWIADAEDGEPRPFTAGPHDSQPCWSPDGSCLAFVRAASKGRPQVALIDPLGGEAEVLTDLPEGSLGAPRWSPTGDALFLTWRATATAWTAAEIEARSEAGLSDPPRVIDDPWYRLDGDGYFDAQRFHLLRVDAEDGSTHTVWDKDALGDVTFDVHPDGRTVVVATNRDKHAYARDWTTELLLVDAHNGRVRAVPGMPSGPKLCPTFSPDGKRVAWAGVIDEDGSRGEENVELFVTDLAKGGARSLTGRTDHCLLAPTLGDCAEISFHPTFCWHPDGRRLWLQIGRHGETHLATVSSGGGPLRFHTKGHKQIRMGNLSDDGRVMAVTVETVVRPPDVHVMDVPKLTGRAPEVTLSTVAVSDVNKELMASLQLSTPKASWVRSEDGTRVHTWVMLPPGASPNRKRPTVVTIHGGPQAQYGWSFFHEFQLMAANGYVVVFSNPRGSKGYGRDVTADIARNWGTKDWDDVRAVSEWCTEQAFCDERRLGVMGGSFGGFMTLWAIGHSRMYRAAIADRCVSNMISMWGSSDIYVWPGAWMPGNTWDDTKALWDMSPQQFMGKVRTPTLLIHSEGDLRCNIAESEQVHAALAVRGVPVRFVRYPRNTSHGMSRGGPPDMRLHRLGEILRWWKERLA
jgi:dipeptidyl aminopeptidase/acylaminoacyl peptidase